MLASALCFLLALLPDLAFAQPHNRQYGKQILEEVIEVEVEIWTTVTVDGPAPSGWHSPSHPNEVEKTRATWITSIPDALSSPATIQNAPSAIASGVEEKVGKDVMTSSLKPAVVSSHIENPASQPNAIISHNKPTLTASSTAATHAAATPKPTLVASSPITTHTKATQKPTGRYPFSALVAFGDNLSDNGNGSYAHHVADRDNPDNAIYGARTWTNAQVAVSFLTDLLKVPMTQNFAFGHAWGGADAGATLDNTMYVSDFHNATVAAELGCPGAPPASQQISAYIAQGVNKEALHFLWIGNNDANMATFYEAEAFTKNLTSGMTKLVSQLLDAGAPSVLVPNIYPKQLAPIVPKYYGWTTPAQQASFGKFITGANAALRTALTALPQRDKIIYYDANAFLTNLWTNAGAHGFTNAMDTNGWPAFCDGDPDQTTAVKAAVAAGTIHNGDQNNWGICVDQKQWDTWFWMQYLDMTSKVHQLLAEDMNKAVAAHFA